MSNVSRSTDFDDLRTAIQLLIVSTFKADGAQPREFGYGVIVPKKYSFEVNLQGKSWSVSGVRVVGDVLASHRDRKPFFVAKDLAEAVEKLKTKLIPALNELEENCKKRDAWQKESDEKRKAETARVLRVLTDAGFPAESPYAGSIRVKIDIGQIDFDYQHSYWRAKLDLNSDLAKDAVAILALAKRLSGADAAKDALAVLDVAEHLAAKQ
jgi:hypothetical protein